MPHLSQNELTDLARGVQAKPRQKQGDHLKNCRKCQNDLVLWRSLSGHAERSASRQAPPTAVRAVKGAFTLHRPRKHSRLERFATLLFDSLLEPAPAGFRAAGLTMGGSVRQMLFRSGSVVVDLRMTPQTASDNVVLVGQVLNLSRESIGNPAVRVVLERGRAPLAAAVANEFGEFVLEYVEKDNLRLRLEVLGQRPLFIPLNTVSGLEPPAAAEAQGAVVRAG